MRNSALKSFPNWCSTIFHITHNSKTVVMQFISCHTLYLSKSTTDTINAISVPYVTFFLLFLLEWSLIKIVKLVGHLAFQNLWTDTLSKIPPTFLVNYFKSHTFLFASLSEIGIDATTSTKKSYVVYLSPKVKNFCKYLYIILTFYCPNLGLWLGLMMAKDFGRNVTK